MFSSLSERLTGVIKNIMGQGRITKENIQASLDTIRNALLEADVALPVIKTFLEAVQDKALGQEVLSSLKPSETFVKVVYDELVKIIGEGEPELNFKTQAPAVIMIAGLQGSGKTTTAAKLANWLKTIQKKSVLLVSLDIYRPAAIEQLRILAEQIGVNYFPSHIDQNPIQIAKDAINHAKKQFIDVVIVDTAGRLHIDQEMMGEIKRIHLAINPIETLLVVDSMMGQDAINVATEFNQVVPLTGSILTKTDGDARGGVALSMSIITKKPIKFIGTGEKIDALELFYPDRIASRILGMGDILTLVEEVHRKIDHAKAEAFAKKVRKGKAFDFEDFLVQLQQMRSMGGANSLLSKLPGLGNMERAKEVINDQAFVKMEAIINSMTLRERHFPAFIKGSNKQRIARGSGTQVQDVNKLIKQFEQMQKMMQKFGGSKMMNMVKKLQGSMPF